METAVIIILQVLILIALGFLSFKFLPAYYNKKAENLATKEDIGEITKKVESVKADFEKNKIKFSLFHQSQVEAISKLYSELGECYQSMDLLDIKFDLDEMNEINQEVRMKKIMHKLFLARKYFISNKFYFNPGLQSKITEIFRSSFSLIIHLGLNASPKSSSKKID